MSDSDHIMCSACFQTKARRLKSSRSSSVQMPAGSHSSEGDCSSCESVFLYQSLEKEAAQTVCHLNSAVEAIYLFSLHCVGFCATACILIKWTFSSTAVNSGLKVLLFVSFLLATQQL